MLKDNYKSGYSLNQRYYKDEGIYNLEINNIFHKHWLFAGHISQVPDKGDYFLFEFLFFLDFTHLGFFKNTLWKK